MPLKADQRAMLQLLLERGQSYDDLASVLGVEPDEVHERARAALEELGGSDPDAEVGLTDYLLGQADPIGRADVVRHVQSDPDTAALAEKIAAQLQLLAPDAELPEIPRAKGARRPRAEEPAEPRRARAAEPRGESRAAAVSAWGRRTWAERRGQSIAILGTLAAALIALVLVLTGVIGGGDDDSAADEGPARLGYPLAPLEPNKDGAITGALPVDQLGITVLSRSSDVTLALSNNDALSEVLPAALQQGQPVIDFQGTPVVNGSLTDAKADRELLSLDLEGVDSDASGKLVIRAQNKQPIIDLNIENLEPAPASDTYVLWALLPEGTELPPPAEVPSQGAVPPSQGAVPPSQGAIPPQGGGGGGGGGG